MLSGSLTAGRKGLAQVVQHGRAQAPSPSASPCLSAPCSTASVPPRLRGRRDAVLARADGNGTGGAGSRPVKFYYFDPHNPENVVELMAKSQEQKAVVTVATNNGYSSNGHGLATSNGNGAAVAVRDVRSELTQVQGLAQQLEAARSTIMKLQQYELMYKESRMRNKQMSSELATLQHMLAEKDMELARQYKRMELEAGERSSLRSQFNAAIDEVKALRNELEEARAAMLDLKGSLPTSLGPSKKAKAALTGGSGMGALPAESDSMLGAPEVLQSLQGLARQLADGMEQEVGSLFGSTRRDK